MSYSRKTASPDRARAEELRTLAELDRKQETRKMLLAAANDCDRAAQSFEDIDASRGGWREWVGASGTNATTTP